MAAPSHVALVPLARAAQRELRRPAREATRLPPPPGVDESLAMPIPDDGQALVVLDDAIRRFAGERARPAVDLRVPASEEEREGALRLYLAGRQKLLEGEPGAAIEDLRQATRFDPGAPEPWRELGEAAMALGLRSEAVSAYNKAIEGGLEDARMLELLGRDALERQAHEEAVRYLARAALATPEMHDALLPHVIDVGLARGLAALGYIAAARDAITQALERPAPSAGMTRYIQEYGAIFRRQGDLWREVGDAECRLGRYDRAMEAYQRAAGLPSLDDELLTGRMVFAAMRSGRPAAAALGVLAEVVEGGGLATKPDIELLRYIAGSSGPVRWNSPVRLEASAALAALRTSLGDDLAPTVESSLVRAQAAVLSPVAARPLLRELLIDGDVNPATARGLLALCETEADAAREAAQVVAARADAAERLAEALLASRFDIEQVRELLTGQPHAPQRLLVAAYMEAGAGRMVAASDLAGVIPEGALPEVAVAAARFEFAISAGRDVEVEGLRRLVPGAASETRQLARALAMAQLYGEAIHLLEPLLGPEAGHSRRERVETVLAAAELAMAAGRVDDAEGWLRMGATLDAHDERVYGQLLSLYAPGGLRADANRSGQALRDLRQNVPESRTASLIIARELGRRGLLPQAEAIALEIAGESPDLGAMEILASIWQMQAARGDEGAVERGLAWIEEARTRRPYAAPLLAGAIMLLVHDDRAQEAADLLRAAMDGGAGRDAARFHERVLRDGLGRRAEADALALERLSGRRLIPADAIELAELLQRADRMPEALEALRPALAPDVTFVGDMARRLMAIADPAAQRAIQSQDESQREIVAELFDRMAERELALPPDLHELRIVLLARSMGADLERIGEAVQVAVRQHPGFRFRLYIVGAENAIAAGREELGIELVGLAFERTRHADPELLVSTAETAARRAIQSGDDGRRALAVALLDQIVERRIVLPPELHELRLVLLGGFAGADMERIVEASEFAAAQHPVLKGRLLISAHEAAAGAGRQRLAFDLLRLACLSIDEPERDLLLRWFVAVVAIGDLDDARSMIEELHERQLLGELFPQQAQAGAEDLRAHAAVTYAVQLSIADREDEAVGAYELALEFDPEEGWACNNLGYLLLEQRRDLERADELLTRARKLLPDEPAVIDSLGWLRYVQGEFEDTLDPDSGAVVREGAISLLRMAAESSYGQQSAVILDHHGDALWRAGEGELAQRQWRAARDVAASRLQAHQNARSRIGRRRDQQAQDSLLSPAQEQEYRDILRSTRAKIAAVNEGQEPAVAAVVRVDIEPHHEDRSSGPGSGTDRDSRPGEGGKAGQGID